MLGWWVVLPWAGCVGDYGLAKHDGALLVQPASLEFGSVEEGDTIVESIHVSNVGRGPLEITGITLDGGGAFMWVTDPSPGWLDGGTTRLVDIVYTPTDELGDVGAAWVETSDGEVVEVPLTGKLIPALEVPGTDSESTSEEPIQVSVPDGETVSIEVSFTVSGGLDVAFLIDTTRSMNSLVDSVKSEFDGIAQDLDEAFVDAGWGLATFDDYAEYPYGSLGADLPFQLRTPITEDRAAMAAGLAAAEIHEGQDAPESSMEALVQALSGRGYDMGCDGVYDAATDVPPYVAGATDVYGGAAEGLATTGNGGMGFRDGRLPIVVYATNYEMRDADDDGRYNTPGGCDDAGFSAVVEAAGAAGARLVGVAVELSEASHAYQQMLAIGEATGSLADLDGNGSLEPAAFAWDADTPLRGSLVSTITQLVGALTWQMVWLEVEDPWGLVQSITPTVLTDVDSGETVTFQITLLGVPLDEEVPLTFHLMGDGGILLASQTVWVTVD